MLKKLQEYLPHWAWAGLTTAFATFLAIFLPALTGWVGQATNAITTHGAIPDISIVVAAAFAGLSAAVAGIGNAFVRFVQTKFGVGSPPEYPTSPTVPVPTESQPVVVEPAPTEEPLPYEPPTEPVPQLPNDWDVVEDGSGGPVTPIDDLTDQDVSDTIAEALNAEQPPS
jgi:hypothetical protein